MPCPSACAMDRSTTAYPSSRPSNLIVSHTEGRSNADQIDGLDEA